MWQQLFSAFRITANRSHTSHKSQVPARGVASAAPARVSDKAQTFGKSVPHVRATRTRNFMRNKMNMLYTLYVHNIWLFLRFVYRTRFLRNEFPSGLLFLLLLVLFIFGRVRLICITKRRPTIVNNSTMTNYSPRHLLVIYQFFLIWKGLPLYSINKSSHNQLFFQFFIALYCS